ncbi:MAG: hypothetical protein Ct9H90mP18_05660 [Gammaproteobacteria bacterium]|nr:MAG: hypothetical protein Ct9H90mP18_05660 [Gammaproteobacteria bacterium]
MIYISLSVVILLLIIIRLLNKQIDSQKQIIKLLSSVTPKKIVSRKIEKLQCHLTKLKELRQT